MSFSRFSGSKIKKKTITNLIFIEHVEDKGGELCGVSEGKELLVNLLEAHGVQLPARTVLNEAFVPAEQSTRNAISERHS